MSMLKAKLSAKQRFVTKVSILPSGCWEWLGSTQTRGYGQFMYKSIPILAHRFSYLVFNGELKKGLVIHHKCENKICVNPQHLEQVTNSINVKRGDLPNRRKTHCKRDHPYDEKNTYINKKGGRICRKCQNMLQKKFQTKLV